MAPAKQVVDLLKVSLHDEGGSEIQQLQRCCQVECSWAMRHRITCKIGETGPRQLPSILMPAANDPEQQCTIKLFQDNIQAAADTISLVLQPAPRQHKQPKVRHGPVTLGKPVTFNLTLQDAHGSPIPEPSRWFRIQQATAQLASGQVLHCHSEDAEGWAQKLDLSHLPLGMGSHQLQLAFDLQPLHWQQQQYESDSPIPLQIPCKLDIRAGQACRLRLKVDPECQELSKLQIWLVSVDAAGNSSNPVDKRIVFTARLGPASTLLARSTDRPGCWYGELCAAVEPGVHCLTIHPEGDSDSLELPQPHDVQITRAPFFESLTMEPMCSDRVQAGAELSMQVKLNLILGAPSIRPLKRRHQGGLRVVLIAAGEQEDPVELAIDDQAGSTFVFTGRAPARAGTTLVKASWTEARQDLVQAFANAEEAGCGHLEVCKLKQLETSAALDILPGGICALAVCPVEHDASTTLMLGDDLPGLGVRLQDQFGNPVRPSQRSSQCRMEATIIRDPACDNSQLQVPVLANGTWQQVEAHWNAEQSAFCLPEAALAVTHQPLDNELAVAAQYEVQMLDFGPLNGLKGAWHFTYSDQLSQREEQAAAQKIVDEYGPHEKGLDKVNNALPYSICIVHSSSNMKFNVEYLLI